jgi:hypothetical protein
MSHKASDSLARFRSDFERLQHIESLHGVFVARTCCEPGRYDAWPTMLLVHGDLIWVTDAYEIPEPF